ncbi:MAG: type I-E CRISPR-associated protein Cse1/CasA [Marinobacterium sp.]|nr:type I-E CRISPR-associated protein Cse1/CasA [Marinobacterium sp.]
MNLITSPWLPVIRRDGSQQWITPAQLTEPDNPVIELAAPRADFQSGLYQWLVGLLQTTFTPDSGSSWHSLYETPPQPARLELAFAVLEPAMELINPEGIAFLQDYDLPDGEVKPIAGLLIDAPGGKTVKDNLDHFIKRDVVTGLCPGCAATALYTLQANAPSGGVGHRTSMRGGGPLTTLLRPPETDATLWQKLWLNVLEDAELRTDSPCDATILPWLSATRTSENKTGVETGPEDGHPLQMYWGMPRRIRLEPSDRTGCCSLCGAEDQPLITQFRTRNYGVNYSDSWLHPLTPYRFDLKKQQPPLSLKAQPGGLGYRHWSGMAFVNPDNGDKAAQVVRFFNATRFEWLSGWDDDSQSPRLWCSGYDMDNMKARCWYDYQMPLFICSLEQQERLITLSAAMLEIAQLALSTLRSHLKEAWASRPKDLKGDTGYLDSEFWQQTESGFYQRLQQFSQLAPQTEPGEAMASWLGYVYGVQQDLFDRWALESTPQDLNLKRIMQARSAMVRKFYFSKTVKQFKARYPVAVPDDSPSSADNREPSQ